MQYKAVLNLPVSRWLTVALFHPSAGEGGEQHGVAQTVARQLASHNIQVAQEAQEHLWGPANGGKAGQA